MNWGTYIVDGKGADQTKRDQDGFYTSMLSHTSHNTKVDSQPQSHRDCLFFLASSTFSFTTNDRTQQDDYELKGRNTHWRTITIPKVARRRTLIPEHTIVITRSVITFLRLASKLLLGSRCSASPQPGTCRQDQSGNVPQDI